MYSSRRSSDCLYLRDRATSHSLTGDPARAGRSEGQPPRLARDLPTQAVAQDVEALQVSAEAVEQPDESGDLRPDPRHGQHDRHVVHVGVRRRPVDDDHVTVLDVQEG